MVILLLLEQSWGRRTLAGLNDTLQSRANCGSDPAWQSTSEAWVNAGTDNQLRGWWQSKQSGQHGTFANELGRSFGEHMTGFECGIGAYSTCINSGCSGEF